MARQAFILLLILAVAGGVGFSLNYEIQTQYDNGKTAYWKIVPRSGQAVQHDGSTVDPSAVPLRPTIRIATFQIGRLDEAKRPIAA